MAMFPIQENSGGYRMHTLAPDLIDTIFVKTEKGHDEISQRRFGLNTRQRRALIVMDGMKAVSVVREMMPGEELDDIISFLVVHGLIVPAKPPGRHPPAAPVERASTLESDRKGRNLPARHERISQSRTQTGFAPANAPALLQDAEKIRHVKDFMTTTATTYLGLLSAHVIRRIESADSATQLMAAAGPWHMALSESKEGKRFAGAYLKQVTAALAGSDVKLQPF